jgi:hypothetical protein
MPSDSKPKSIELLNAIGGEPLDGSGFEDEELEDGFDVGGEDGND